MKEKKIKSSSGFTDSDNDRYPPVADSGKFFAFYSTLLSEHQRKIEEYKSCQNESLKKAFLVEINEDAQYIKDQRQRALIWDMINFPGGEILEEFEEQTPFNHSPEYRIVITWGQKYNLTPNQSLVIRALHEAYLKGITELGAAEILKEIDSYSIARVRDVFKGNLKAWKTLVEYHKRTRTYSLKI